jgi:hypothetical protein
MAAVTKNRTYGKIAGFGLLLKNVNNIKNLTWNISKTRRDKG